MTLFAEDEFWVLQARGGNYTYRPRKILPQALQGLQESKGQLRQGKMQKPTRLS